MATVAMIAHLAQNVTTLCEIIKITARDETVVAFAAHTRDLVFDGVTYKAAMIEPTRPVRAVGLEADVSEIRGGFTDGFTKEDVLSEKWRGATVQKEIVNYLDLTMLSVCKQVGKVGKIEPIGDSFILEFRSLVDPFKQLVGEITSNPDRNRTIEETGVDTAPMIHSTSVASVTDQRTFKTLYVASDDDYFTNGRVEWLTGLNAGKFMEIKTGVRSDTNTRTLITLQEKMVGVIANGDTLKLYRGYVGTREAAKALGEEAMLNYNGEVDMPPEHKLYSYPEG